MSEGIVSAEQISYKQSMYSHPSYVHDPQFPNTFGQPINLNTSQNPITFNLPPEVLNLAQSYLMYTVTLPAAGANLGVLSKLSVKYPIFNYTPHQDNFLLISTICKTILM